MTLNVDCVEFWKDFHNKLDIPSFKLSFLHHLKYTQAEGITSATPLDTYMAASLAVRDRLIERMLRTQRAYLDNDVKRVYYMSMEFLMGRYLANNVLNLKYFDTAMKALEEMGLDLDVLRMYEVDAGLGNGGLGRLAACFLDSLATLEYPAYGYGIRYQYGIFRQEIENGFQIEKPDEWLRWGNPWEIARPESYQIVEMGGKVDHFVDGSGNFRAHWSNTEKTIAVPYDTPILGYANNTVNLLRLWSARAPEAFNFEIFNSGDFVNAVVDNVQSETITRVLYPNDETYKGRELRYRQQVFFVQATLKDLIRRYLKNHDDLTGFADKNAIQLNDTHPSLSVSELMRLLIDIYEVPWDKAWDITRATLAYTNHTLLPEALEKWSVEMIQRITPRNLEIIYEINRRFLEEVHVKWPGDDERRARMSIIAEGDSQQVRMAHLAMVGSHSINGVAALHTKLLKERVVPDFAEMYPEKFNNKTNGVTQRRWMNQANPELSQWITNHIGSDWLINLDELKKLEKLTDKKAELKKFRDIKNSNKMRLTKIIKKETGIDVNPKSIFDIQIKRIHEYKRQHLNALHILYLYNKIKRNPDLDVVPRTFIFGGKAAPGYFLAKRIIKLIGNIANLVNQDPDIGDKLKVVFLPNYRVSLAEKMFPAADVSEQISTAGKEASGTGNMKFALNGALTIGTLDGANVEILEEVGEENIVIFGLEADEVQEMRHSYNPYEIYENTPHIKEVLDQMNSHFLAPEDATLFEPIFNSLVHQGDQFFVLADFDAYIAAQEEVEKLYRDKDKWTKITMLNMMRCGKFSSDRTIREYANEIWGIKPLSITLPDADGAPCE